jgi:hypothetical protein
VETTRTDDVIQAAATAETVTAAFQTTVKTEAGTTHQIQTIIDTAIAETANVTESAAVWATSS